MGWPILNITYHAAHVQHRGKGSILDPSVREGGQGEAMFSHLGGRLAGGSWRTGAVVAPVQESADTLWQRAGRSALRGFVDGVTARRIFAGSQGSCGRVRNSLLLAMSVAGFETTLFVLTLRDLYLRQRQLHYDLIHVLNKAVQARDYVGRPLLSVRA